MVKRCLKGRDIETIARFAMLYRGMIICMMMGERLESALALFDQSKEIVQMSDQVVLRRCYVRL